MLTTSHHLSPTTLTGAPPHIHTLFFGCILIEIVVVFSPYRLILCYYMLGRSINISNKSIHLLFIHWHNRSEDLMRHEWFHQSLCPPPTTQSPIIMISALLTKIIMTDHYESKNACLNAFIANWSLPVFFCCQYQQDLQDIEAFSILRALPSHPSLLPLSRTDQTQPPSLYFTQMPFLIISCADS